MHQVLTLRQALSTGLSKDAIRHRVSSRRWQRVFSGVFLTHSGKLGWQDRALAATLARGPGAVVSLACALHLWGLSEYQPPIITLAEPSDTHRTRSLPGVRTTRRRRLSRGTRYGIPVTGLAQTILDVLAIRGTSLDDVAALISRAVSQRRITVGKLRAELLHHPRHPWASVIDEVLSAAAEGLGSVAEFRYVRDVELAHCLPRMQRQVPLDDADAVRDGRSRRMDFRDEERGVGLEIDGALYHADRQLIDRGRDRKAAAAGGVTLRAGWIEVVAMSCELAADVAGAQRARGWAGYPVRCGSDCKLPESALEPA